MIGSSEQSLDVQISFFGGNENDTLKSSSINKRMASNGPRKSGILLRVLNFLFVKTILTKNTSKIRDLLDLPPAEYMHAVRRAY